jgi:hypothetical protein
MGPGLLGIHQELGDGHWHSEAVPGWDHILRVIEAQVIREAVLHA